jgi:hypothetical protein
MGLDQEGATYGPRATSGPRRLIFLSLTLPFRLKCGPRDTNKEAVWPADKNSCPSPGLDVNLEYGDLENWIKASLKLIV